jgi:hypothetical protein
MATKPKVSAAGWLIGALTIPIELLLAVPFRWQLQDMGILNDEHDLFNWPNLYLAFGVLGILALLTLLFGLLRSRRLGEIPSNRGLTLLYAVAMTVAFLQALLLLGTR